jgi:hypothetical protein
MAMATSRALAFSVTRYRLEPHEFTPEFQIPAIEQKACKEDNKGYQQPRQLSP